jgi:pSer/pThr/pTyr-binding forkhead associated (FHA) protein
MVKPGDRTLLGRSDASSNQKPDLDLAPYGAIEKGVSRVHAAIDRQEDTLTLVDMGSSNGTRLNGTALPPNEPHILRDGDEIEMGKMTIHIYFEERASGELHS